MYNQNMDLKTAVNRRPAQTDGEASMEVDGSRFLLLLFRRK